jgi:hypothetical protein
MKTALRSIFTNNFNDVDLITLISFSILFANGHWLYSLVLLVVGIIISALGTAYLVERPDEDI